MLAFFTTLRSRPENLDFIQVNFDDDFVASCEVTYLSIDSYSAWGTVNVTFFPSAVGTTHIAFTAYDTEGLPRDTYIHTIETYAITGWTVEEKAWGEEDWSEPEDGRVLWTDNENRWRVTTESSGELETDDLMKDVTVEWRSTAWSTYDPAAPESSNWSQGTSTGDMAVRPRIDFGDGTVWQGDPERYFVTSISSVEWMPTTYLGAVTDLGTHTEDGYLLAQLNSVTQRVLPWKRDPQPFVTARVEVKIDPALPAGFPGTPTVHVAWYDPDNTVANVPAVPPDNVKHGLRDNKAESGLSVETPTLEFAAADNGRKTSYHNISGSRFGDNFIAAVHPNQGSDDPNQSIVKSCEFRFADLDGTSGSGSGADTGSGSGSGDVARAA